MQKHIIIGYEVARQPKWGIQLRGLTSDKLMRTLAEYGFEFDKKEGAISIDKDAMITPGIGAHRYLRALAKTQKFQVDVNSTGEFWAKDAEIQQIKQRLEAVS